MRLIPTLLIAAAIAAGCSRPVPDVPVWRFESTEIDESSGIVGSRVHDGVFWTHNDSFDANRIFAVTATGKLLSEVTIEGATNTDWEDIAVDESGNLYVGDIGNNKNNRQDLAVYVISEPDPVRTASTATVVKKMEYAYPDQAGFPDGERMNFDAESLFWARDHLYILTKHRSDTKTRLFRFPTLDGVGKVALELVGERDLGGNLDNGDAMTTAGDATPDGARLALLSYGALWVFHRPAGSDNYLAGEAIKISLEREVSKQCEAAAWDGSDVIIMTNEQGELHRIKIPAAGTTQPLKYP